MQGNRSSTQTGRNCAYQLNPRNKIEQVQSDLGVGVLAGGGYAWPIAEGTRLMGGLQFALRRVEKDYYMSFGLTLGALF